MKLVPPLRAGPKIHSVYVDGLPYIGCEFG
jgi:hypothetical protein